MGSMDVSFSGIKDHPSYKLASGIARGTDEGKVVKVSAAKTVSLCSAEDKFCGVLETIELGNAIGCVSEYGYKTLSYSGTAPSVGEEVELVANATGGVKVPATTGTGKKYRVVNVDTTNTLVTLKLHG